MKAYAVFAGGGVRGAALAGCLDAVEEQLIEVVGYGGTSAGALVASLATVGYSGKELHKILLDDLHPRRFLDDEGVALEKALAWVSGFPDLSSHGGFIDSARFCSHLYGGRDLLRRLAADHGIYSGKEFSSTLARLLANSPRLRDRAKEGDITFADLKSAGCRPLKIVASDVSSKQTVVFSENDATVSVVQAVRASVSYPFVFQPVVIASKRLADGGLASNLPSFLYAEEHQVTQYPTFAFDLGSQVAAPEPGLAQYSRDLLDTALGASDALLVRLIEGVHQIVVPTPSGVTSLGFQKVTPADIEAMFNAGYRAATTFLNSFPPLRAAREAGDEIQKQLQARYGDPKLFVPALWGLAEMIQTRTTAKDVRSQIMLPTGRPNGSRIVTYHYGFRDNDPDVDLELEDNAGCTGKANTTREPTVADLADAQKNYPEWKMTALQQAKVATDRRSMLSVCIFAWSRDTSKSVKDLPVLGVLSVDSSTSLAETGWVKAELKGEMLIETDPVQVMQAWADIIAKLLRN